MWAVLSAILPWSTFALAGALFYFVRKTGGLTDKLAVRESQVRELSARNDYLKADGLALRDRLSAIDAEYQRVVVRLAESQIRAGRIQAEASEVARKMAEGGTTDENYKRLMRLLDSP